MTAAPDKILKLSALLAQRVGLSNISTRSRWGSMIKASGVQRTNEWDRIDALPRRRWQDSPDLPQLKEWLHQELRRPGGEEPCGPQCRCPRELWDNQVAAFETVFDLRGGFFPQGVGKGKALISLLIPTILGGLTQR